MATNTTTKDTGVDTNPDAITGESGSHPAGTGIGAASGAATGAAIGAIGGPVGAVIGGVSGAVVGGLIGHGIGEAVDPTEDAHWRASHSERPYYRDQYGYDDYEPAYRLGYNAADSNRADDGTVRDYDHGVEEQLAGHYDKYKGDSRLEWADARLATRDAYDRRAESTHVDAGSR